MFRDYVCVASRLYRRGGRIRFAKKQSRSIPLAYPRAIRLGFSIGRVYKSPWSATSYRSSRTAVENRIVSILGSEPTVRPKYRNAAEGSGMVVYPEVIQIATWGLVPRSPSVVSEARGRKNVARARWVCALSIQRLEGRRWRLRWMRANCYGNSIFRLSVIYWFCSTQKNEQERELQSHALRWGITTKSPQVPHGSRLLFSIWATLSCRPTPAPAVRLKLYLSDGPDPARSSNGQYPGELPPSGWHLAADRGRLTVNPEVISHL